MKKFLSLLLAVIMIASVAVVAASAVSVDIADTAAGKATVTVTGFHNESTDTKTYQVGETFTVYTALNMSELYDQGMISSITASQTYDSSVLELAEETYTTGFNQGAIIDKATVLPILSKADVLANAGETGKIQYNATVGSPESPYTFSSDDSMLLVVRYKVIAEGDASITTNIRTLCLPDYWCSKVVSKGVVVAGYENFSVNVSLSEPAATGSTVSGTVTSFRSDTDKVKVELLSGETVVAQTEVTGNTAAYTLEDVEDGDYVLRVSKDYHAPRKYDVKVEGDTVQDAKIHLYGDINGNGKITMADYSRVYAHLSGTRDLVGYEIDCADAGGSHNGKITMSDASAVYAHLNGSKDLFPES